jgi:multicomponent Na+:H+ antiporter subunit C
MTLIFSLAIGVLFGSGAFLLLKPDLFRIVVGIVLIANAANLALMASGLSRGRSPIHPLGGERVSDPLVQAMTITALVISFAVTALLLAVAYRIYASSHTVDLDELSHAESRHERELEREELSL